MALPEYDKEKDTTKWFCLNGTPIPKDWTPVKEFTALATDRGVVLCERDQGSFLTLQFKQDLENLKALLDKIEVIE